MRTLLCLFVSLLMSGCAIPISKPPISKETLNETGIFVFSTESVQSCLAHGIDLRIRSDDRNEQVGFFLMTNPMVQKDYEATRGLLLAIQLPVGRYSFTYSQTNTFVSVNYDEPFESAEIEKGKVKYLGEIEVDGCLSITSSSVEDQYIRDVELFTKRHPEFSQAEVTKDLLKKKIK